MTDPLADMNEAAFRTDVLVPLLRAIGYRDVEHYHGPNEFGKDIVAWKQDVDGSRENLAVVAKVGPINARATGDAATIGVQVRQALGSTYTDPTTGEERVAHRVIVATTGTIREASRKALLAQFDTATRRAVRFWSGDKVRELVAKHLPTPGAPDYLAAVHRQTAALEHFDVFSTVGPAGVQFEIAARRDGTPFARTTLSFPETAEGDAILSAFERHVEAGEPVTVPAAFVDAFEFHPELAVFLGPGGPADLVLGDDRPAIDSTVSVEVDGPLGTLRVRNLPVSTARMGTQRGALRTDPAAHPFALSLALERVEGGVEVATTVEIDPGGHPVQAALQALRVWDAVGSGSSIRLVLDAQGDVVLRLDASSHTHRPHHLAPYLEDLAALERYLGEVRVPEILTQTDLDNAALLRSILTTGVGVKPFRGTTLTYAPGEGSTDSFLRVLGSGEPYWMREIKPAPRFALVGHDVALGPAHSLFQVTLAPDEADRVRSRLAAGDARVPVRFEAAGSSQRTTVYRDHLPPALRDRYHELRDRLEPLLDWSRLPDTGSGPLDG